MSRLFFALWPDPETRQQISNIIDTLPAKVGRRVVPENIHITLAFLGSIDENIAECVQARVENIRAHSFNLSLDKLGWWKRPQIVWLAPSFVPDPLTHLAMQINKAASDCGIKLEDRAYKPHMTLMRKVKQNISENPTQPIDWQVDRFVLVQSVTHSEGVRYSMIRTWVLDS